MMEIGFVEMEKQISGIGQMKVSSFPNTDISMGTIC